MANVLTPTLECNPCKLLTRVRRLPIEGSALVSVGDTVSFDTKVLEASLKGELLILRLPERMGLSRDEVLKSLKVKEGEYVKENETLAFHSSLFGLLKNQYKSPYGGTIEFISKEAHIGLRLKSKEIKALAYISGKVTEVKEKHEVTVETNACFLQGIFGVGGERFGELKVLDCSPNELLTSKDIPDDVKGKILVGGMQADISAINKVSELGGVGLVTASLDDRALREFLGYDLGVAITGDEDIPITLMITEGFGKIAMSERILGMLREHDGKICAINGATQVRAGAKRPELVVPLNDSKDEDLVAKSTELNVGSRVRLIRVPYFGVTGEVIELPSKPRLIATGAKTRVLKVKLDSDKSEVIVPRANIELL